MSDSSSLPSRAGVPLVLLVALTLTLTTSVVVAAERPAGAAEAVGAVRYRSPVDAPIIDHFRAPPTPYAAGNRGLDYRTDPLSPVGAVADGVVIFAGAVGGTRHITVRHADGLRSSYSFLATIDVAAGQVVVAGQALGVTGEVFHLGFRDPAGAYLDPEPFLVAGSSAARVRLVPEPTSTDANEAPVRGGPLREVVAFASVTQERADDLRRVLVSESRVAGGPDLTIIGEDPLARVRLWAHDAVEAGPEVHRARIEEGIREWLANRNDCTDRAVRPSVPTARRIIVEVGGIGSTSGGAAVDRVDVAALGYAPGDVIRFSYAGGRVPPGPHGTEVPTGLDVLDTRTYDAVDSQQDIPTSAEALAALLRDIARVAPGVPIDVVAHSQGGVVARLALDASSTPPSPPEVQTLVTLGSPHQGADLAAVVASARLDHDGVVATDASARALGIDLDPGAPAARQLAPTSPFIARLQGVELAPRVRFTSVGARGDLVVTANRTVVSGTGSHHTVVPTAGLHAHDQLPGSPDATREIALATAGLPPTCRSFTGVVTDLVVSEQLSRIESRAAWSLAARGATGSP